MSETEQAKAALDALASETAPDGGSTADDERADYRTVIERAVEATADLDAAVEFVEVIGLERLEDAVEEAERELSGLAADGREALAAFERYRAFAAQKHFHRGHGTPLGGDDEGPAK